MAENKKSFLLYCDLIHTFEELTDDEAGKLIKHVLRYVNDLNPEAPDRLTKISFEPIKQALKRDLIKYEAIREKKRLAGLASAESKKQNQHVSTCVESVQHNSTHSTVNDSVSVSVNDNVSDNVNVIKKKERPQAVEFDFSFVANNYKECFMKWINFKKEIKSQYKSQTSLQTCYNNLLKLSGGNPQKAADIVDQSIGNNWQGLFELKPQQQNQNTPPDTEMYFYNGQWREKAPKLTWEDYK